VIPRRRGRGISASRETSTRWPDEGLGAAAVFLLPDLFACLDGIILLPLAEKGVSDPVFEGAAPAVLAPLVARVGKAPAVLPHVQEALVTLSHWLGSFPHILRTRAGQSNSSKALKPFGTHPCKTEEDLSQRRRANREIPASVFLSLRTLRLSRDGRSPETLDDCTRLVDTMCMCGRYTLAKPEKIVVTFQPEIVDTDIKHPRYNIGAHAGCSGAWRARRQADPDELPVGSCAVLGR